MTAAGAAAPGYAAARTVTNGSCEPGSEAIGQAYRCFAGNGIYDPCWAEKAATPEVLCLPAPWTRAEVRIRLLAPRPALLPVATDLGEPWGVQLASGQRCLLAQGAHDVFRGRIIDFLCRPGLALLRGLDEKSRLWTAQRVNGSSTAAMSLGPREQIVIAWYGRPDRPG